MKATIERAKLLRCLSHVQSVVERRNTIPILSNVLIEAARRRHGPDHGDRPRPAGDRERRRGFGRGAGAITVSAHLLFDIARKLPDGSQVELRDRRQPHGGQGRAQPLLAADAAARRLPGDRRGRPADQLRAARAPARRAHRPHPLRDLDRGDALLPQRHLPARLGRRPAGAQGRGDRRPPPRALHAAARPRAPRACPT